LTIAGRPTAATTISEHQAAVRGAGHEAFKPGRQPPGVDRVETVDVLFGVDAGDHRAFVDMLGQGQLNEDTVDRRIGVELRDQSEQLGLAGAGGQAMLEALHPRRNGRLALRADIDRRCRIVADQHHRQPGPAPGLREYPCRAFRHAGAQPGGECFSVDHSCRHSASP